jgi:hypothetical protein
MIRFFTVFFLLFIAGCAHEPKGAEIGRSMSAGEYSRLIKTYTKQATRYEGFYNKFEVYVTFLNSKVQDAILQKKSDIQLWTVEQARKEREKMFQENSTQTQFAVSLFIPSTRLNDLHKGTSIWKIYIEAGGQRYPGKAKRRNGKLEDLAEVYPTHNRWSVPYDIVFDVPLSAIETTDAKFILTSSQGAAELVFPKL